LDLRPDLRAAKALESQTGAEVLLAEAQGRPDITVSAGYSWQQSEFDDPLRVTPSGSPLQLTDRDNILKVGVSIPLQSRKRNAGNVAAATARENAARLRRQHLEVNTHGGELKTYEVQIDSNKLMAYHVPLEKVISALQKTTRMLEAHTWSGLNSSP
jgi:hypothetical protein